MVGFILSGGKAIGRGGECGPRESTCASKRGRRSSCVMYDGMAESKPNFPELPLPLLLKKSAKSGFLYEINNFCQFYFLIFWLCHAARGILVPQPGVAPSSPALEAWSRNYWTSGKVLCVLKSLCHSYLADTMKCPG